MSEFGPKFDRAQAAYDAQEPTSDDNCVSQCPECHGCGVGECGTCGGVGEIYGHQWKRRRVAYINGEYITEVKCRICGKMDVI